jgi:hypothetical protein
MLHCGFVWQVVTKKFRTSTIIPSIEPTGNSSSYTWGDFIAEFNHDIEISHIFQVNGKNVKEAHWAV